MKKEAIYDLSPAKILFAGHYEKKRRTPLFFGVDDGARTHDPQNHNLML